MAANLPTVLDLDPLRRDGLTVSQLRARIQAERLIDLCHLHAEGMYVLSKEQTRTLHMLLERVLPPLPPSYAGSAATPEEAAKLAAVSGTDPGMTRFVLERKHGWTPPAESATSRIPFVVVVPSSMDRDEWERIHGRRGEVIEG